MRSSLWIFSREWQTVYSIPFLNFWRSDLRHSATFFFQKECPTDSCLKSICVKLIILNRWQFILYFGWEICIFPFGASGRGSSSDKSHNFKFVRDEFLSVGKLSQSNASNIFPLVFNWKECKDFCFLCQYQ